MANRFGTFLKKMIVGRDANLVSLDEPYRVIRRILRGRKINGILDAGASSGRLTGKMLELFPEAQAYAFEPHPMYREKLEALASGDPRIHPVYAAISDHTGSLDLNITKSPGGTSLFAPGERVRKTNPEGSVIRKVETVEVNTIDNWARENNIGRIELMKFDIQGGELDAFRGARETMTDSTLVVYTEILFNRMYEGGSIYSEIDLCLREYGFVLYDIFKPRYDGNNLLLWGNGIFVHAGKLGL